MDIVEFCAIFAALRAGGISASEEPTMTLFTFIEILGTLAFAISGIRLASAKRFDWFGAYVVGFTTAIGGGTLRDLMLSLTPFWMLDCSYLVVTAFALGIVVVYGRYLIRLNNTFFIFDAIGLGLFTVVGVEKTLGAGFPLWVAVIMGTITGAAGGVLRDILINEEPLIFRKEIYALACVFGGLVYGGGRAAGLSGATLQIVTALSVIVFGVFFATVSSRMVGLIGSSNNPVSGMAIATLLISTMLLKATGNDGIQGMIAAIVIGGIICALASAKVNSTYARYDQVRNHAGITGAMAAEQILRMDGIYDVQVMRVSGKLTDHYDPANHVLRLSDSTYGSTSVAALGVAAHECGHAIQHARHYVPLTIRGALVPVANFGSGISWPLIIMGLFIRGEMSTLFINLGILMFSLAVLFQIITLPVEFNASGRALKILKKSGMLYESEVREARSVLTTAALTYVASAASALLQLLRILIKTGGRRNDDE